jgi:hypothetical protein
MQEESEASQVFTPEMIDMMARIWTRSIITLIDVRFQNVASQYPLEQYKMPSSKCKSEAEIHQAVEDYIYFYNYQRFQEKLKQRAPSKIKTHGASTEI